MKVQWLHQSASRDPRSASVRGIPILWRFGVSESLPPAAAEREVVTNFVWLIYVLIPLSVSAVAFALSFFGIYSEAERIAQTVYGIANAVVGGGVLLLFVLRVHRPLLQWNALLCLWVLGFLILVTIGLGSESRVESFFFVFFLFPFFFLHQSRVAQLSMILVTIPSFLFALWYTSSSDPLLPVPLMNTATSYAFPLLAITQLVTGIAYFSRAVNRSQQALEAERQRSDKLLRSILPDAAVAELKDSGRVTPKSYEHVTILFADFVGFTQIAADLTPTQLVSQLDRYFSAFDEISTACGLHRLKTIGDGYMCAGGIPDANQTHAVDSLVAALQMRDYVESRRQRQAKEGEPAWGVRIGVHTGPVTAGVVGTTRFAYDIWGDAVNVASRLESSGKQGHINISADLHELVGHLFACKARGAIAAKNKGEIEMYFVNAVLPEYERSDGGADLDELRSRLESA